MSKIKNVKVKVVEVPLKTTWQTSLYATSTRAHCVVKIETEDGIDAVSYTHLTLPTNSRV